MNSSGSAMAENAKWLDSIEGKTFQLTNAMQALWNSTINSEVIKYFLDVALGATKLVDTIGMLPSALGAALVYFTKFKNYNMGDIFGGMSAQIKGYMQASSKLGILKGVSLGSSDAGFNTTAIAAYAQAVQHLNAQKQAQILISNNLNQAQVREVLIANGVNEAKATELSMNAALTASKNSLKTTTVAEAVATQLSEEAQKEKVVADFLAANGSKKLTAELLNQAVAQGILTGEQAASIMSTNALAFSWSSLGTAIKAAFMSNPVGMILTIASAVMMLSPLLDDVFKSTEEKMQDLQTEWNELSDKISNSSKDFKQLKSSADSVIPRFSKLAKGVDKFGKNVNLTDSEYEEFLSLNNQLAEMFPEINNGMDENGNAMLSLSYNANTLEDSLLSLVDAKRAAANEEIADTMPDAAKNVKETVKLYNKEKNVLQDRIDAYKQAQESMEDFNTDAFKQQYQELYGDNWEEQWKIAANNSVDIGALKVAYGADSDIEGWNNLLDKFTINGQIDWGGVLNSAEMHNAIAGVETQFENIQTKIQNKWKQLNPIVSAWANTDYTFQNLDGDLQNAAQAMMGNIDFSKYDTAEDIQDHIQKDILKPLDDLTPEAQKKLSKLMSIDTKNISVAEYKEKIQQAADEFAAAQDKWSASDILKSTGYQENLDAIDTVIYKIEQLKDVDISKDQLLTLDADQISQAFDIVKDYGIKSFDDLQKALDRKTFEVNIDITAEQEGFDALQTAIDEATSAAGMSAESIDKIEARYRDLAGYNHADMFEETAHGIKLNASALRELEKEYNSSNADKLDAQLEDLTDQYNELSAEIATCTDASERANLYRQRQNVLDQINDTATLAAQYRGLASAYNQWQRLKGGSSNKDTYEGVVTGIKDMKEAMSDGWMDEWQKGFVDMFTNADTSGWSTKQYVDEWTKLRTEVVGAGHTVMDFFTTDDDGNATSKGVYNLLEAIEATMPQVVKFKEETGEKYFDFSGVGDKAVAEAVGINEEVLHILLNAGKSTGIEVNLESAYTDLADFRDHATEVNDQLKALGATDYTFNINSMDINDVEEQIKEAHKALNNLVNEDGTLKVDAQDYENAKTLLATLISQKQILEQPAILKVNTDEAQVGTEVIIKTLQEFKSAYNEWEVKLAVGEDTTEAKAKLDTAMETLRGQDPEIMAKLGIDPTQTAADINTALLNITPEIMVNAGLDTSLIEGYQAAEHTAEGTVIWDNNVKKVTDWMARPKIVDGEVEWDNNVDKVKTFFEAKGVINFEVVGFANGTAHVGGTARAGGDWGAKKTETALVGELGPEILVRGSRWTTIGENGAEFTQVKKGDIIFNHQQTEEILKNGHISSRGKIKGGNSAFAHGTAYAMAIGDTIENDNAYKKKLKKEIESIVNISGGTRSDAVQIYNYNIGTATTMPDLVGHPRTGSSSSSSSSSDDGYGSNATPEATNDDITNNSGNDDTSKGSGGGKDKDKDEKETFDWIEVKLEEINEKIGLTEAKLENASNLTEQNSTIDELISIHQDLYDNLIAGEKKYHEYAETLLAKIPAEYRQMAQDGTIAIEEFVGDTDKETLEAIQNYREWTQKAADAAQQAEETLTAIRDLAIQQFDNAYEAGSVRADVEDSQTEKLQNAVDLDEAKGLITSDAYYIAMMENSNKKIEYLTAAKNNMQKEFNDLMTSEPDFVGSNKYYELLNELYGVDSEIDEARIELEEFQNSINDLDWENFDQLIARLDYIQEDTQNIIDLMGNDDMFVKPEGKTYEDGTVKFWNEDDVSWTDEGLATLGLYAQQMEVAELKAEQYAEQIKNLTKDYNDGLYSENEYLEKLNELKDGQYDSIKAYQDAQNAIKDLNAERIEHIKEGINKEIEAYEELIETKKENLREDKNSRDFKRSVSDKQREIDDIRMQIAALSNNHSAQARAKLANLQAELAEKEQDLEDLYYDHSLEVQEKAYDDSLESFRSGKEAELEELDKYLEDVKTVISDSLNVVKENADAIGATLIEKTEEYNLTVSDAVLSPWKDGASAISAYQEAFNTATSSTTAKLNAIRDAWQEVINKTKEAGEANVAQINKENAAYVAAGTQQTTTSTNTPKTTASSGGTYTVKRGDTLWGIAASKLGSGARWQEIYNLNKNIISNPDLIQPGWKLKLPKYAKGTTGVKNNQLAIIDELGEELQLVPDGNGRLAYMTKGTSIIPHDITENLMTLGQLDPQDIIDRNRPVIGAPHVSTNETVISIEYGDILHIDNYSGDKPENLSKLIDKAFDKHMKQLNAEIRKFTR